MTRNDGRILPVRQTSLGDGTRIRRALPQKHLPRVGAWCFLDHFGPVDIGEDQPGMRIGPHPHIGLQTVSWLLEGEVLHRDSLGHEQMIRPGQLNLMTAGSGITHSEETPSEHGGRLHGLQFWIALPETERNRDASFEHHATLPEIERDGMRMTLFAGNALGEQSLARLFSPLLGMDIRLDENGRRELPLDERFEHALMVTSGRVRIDGHELEPGALFFLSRGHASASLDNEAPARLVLLGGEPFDEELVIWWNFVARQHEEIVAAREQWMNGKGFARETGYDGPPIPAPEITARLKAR